MLWKLAMAGMKWFSTPDFKLNSRFEKCIGKGGSMNFYLLYYSPLENNSVGCFWKHHFVGAVYYADDVALLASSPSALRNMLSMCINFADSHHLTFNASKTQLIEFYKSHHTVLHFPRFTFLGQTLSLSKLFSYSSWPHPDI